MLLATVLLAAAAAPPASPLLDSQRRAQALLQAALQAHGGERAAGPLRVRYRGEVVADGQSLAALAPFESYPSLVEIVLDPASGLSAAYSENAISGDFRFFDRIVVRGGKGFSLDPLRNVYEDANAEPSFLLDRHLPHRLVQQALRAPASLRHLGVGEGGLERVSYASGGQLLTLAIDPATRLVRRLEQVSGFGPFGDGLREVEFADYGSEAGLPLPGAITTRSRNPVHGVVESRVQRDPAFGAGGAGAPAPADLELPPGAVKGDYSWRPPRGVELLAPGVHLLRNVSNTTGQWSYNVLAVEFADHLLVAEAPLSSAVSEDLLARLRQAAPGKPVRYVVQSHHHSDHLGGIRAYVAEGATLVLTPTAAPLVERIAAAHPTMSPDRLARRPRPPVIETLPARGSRTFKDATQEAVVFDVGPNPHAAQMLAVWLPAHGVLYQADLVNDGEYQVNATTRSFAAWLKGKGLEVRTLAGLHGRTLARADPGRGGGEAPAGGGRALGGAQNSTHVPAPVSRARAYT
jgi:glyoxylase-like metal-dependent hydrolase (beta-lactamase superfamily II)